MAGPRGIEDFIPDTLRLGRGLANFVGNGFQTDEGKRMTDRANAPGFSPVRPQTPALSIPESPTMKSQWGSTGDLLLNGFPRGGAPSTPAPQSTQPARYRGGVPRRSPGGRFPMLEGAPDVRIGGLPGGVGDWSTENLGTAPMASAAPASLTTDASFIINNGNTATAYVPTQGGMTPRAATGNDFRAMDAGNSGLNGGRGTIIANGQANAANTQEQIDLRQGLRDQIRDLEMSRPSSFGALDSNQKVQANAAANAAIDQGIANLTQRLGENMENTMGGAKMNESVGQLNSGQGNLLRGQADYGEYQSKDAAGFYPATVGGINAQAAENAAQARNWDDIVKSGVNSAHAYSMRKGADANMLSANASMVSARKSGSGGGGVGGVQSRQERVADEKARQGIFTRTMGTYDWAGSNISPPAAQDWSASYTRTVGKDYTTIRDPQGRFGETFVPMQLLQKFPQLRNIKDSREYNVAMNALRDAYPDHVYQTRVVNSGNLKPIKRAKEDILTSGIRR